MLGWALGLAFAGAPFMIGWALGQIAWLLRTTMRRMAQNNIVITSKVGPPVVVELVGQNYHARAPKKALLLATMMKLKVGGDDPAGLDHLFDVILGKMFGKETGAKVKARMYAEDDDLDIDHIMELANKLMGVAAGNPTGSSSGSPTTPSGTGETSTAGVAREGSAIPGSSTPPASST